MSAAEYGKNRMEIQTSAAPERPAATRLFRFVLRPWALVSARISLSEGTRQTN